MERIPAVEEFTPLLPRDGKIHVRLVSGYFQNLRRLTSWPLLLLFFGAVWIQIDGKPWLQFSFIEHHITLFGHTLPWNELPLLAGLLIAGACLLFFCAVAWGRVWCGFACPQSIWTWLFIRIEELTEGKAYRRAKQEKQPLTPDCWLRRMVKHTLWLCLATATAITFSGYFVPIREIMAEIVNRDFSLVLWSWIGVIAGMTYLNAGLVREKICLFACPYSRFQAVMFDKHTQTVNYDARRGEPRSHKPSTTNKRAVSSNNKSADNSVDNRTGDCVDCLLCVQACPVGIDIRHGLQAACIDCGACIDACNGVMEKLQRPLGLIRYASDARLAGETGRFWRPRLLSYGGVLLLATAVVGWGFAHTQDLVVAIERNRQHIATNFNGNETCNNYRIKVEGFDNRKHIVELHVNGNPQLRLLGPQPINLQHANGEWLAYRVCAQITPKAIYPVQFTFSYGDTKITKASTFLTHSF